MDLIKQKSLDFLLFIMKTKSNLGEFIEYDNEIHESLLVDLSEEYFSWMASEFQQRYDIDLFKDLKVEGTFKDSFSEQKAKIQRYAKISAAFFKTYKPPDGIYYMLQVKGKIVGMGAFIRKKETDLGWIKRMYIKSAYRGKGHGKAIFKHLIKKGKEFGCSTIQLETAKFMSTAQHIYREAGFYYRDVYPDTEVPVNHRPYWLFMEKKLSKED